MPNYDLLELRDPDKLARLKLELEPKKEYIEKDLWVIKNFLEPEELEWLNKEAKDPEGWYPTMRSPYANNVQNKFLGYVPQYGEDGVMLPPHPSINPVFNTPTFLKEMEDRLESVLPRFFAGAGAFQSIMGVSDEEMMADLGGMVDFSIPFHYERDEEDPDEVQRTVSGPSNDNPDMKTVIAEGKITGSFNIYINDDFDGGILEFKNKSYTIRPEPGMLINIPISKEFEHRVTRVTNGNRHTIYGRCWDSLENSHLSSRDDC